MPHPHCLQIYEILDNGNILQGIYTNTDGTLRNQYDIDSEIATKVIFDDKGVLGLYNCRFIETSSPAVVTHCRLEITRHGAVYNLKWTNGAYFTGIGLMVGNNHLAISYAE